MRQLEIIVRQTDETGKELSGTTPLRLTFEVMASEDLRPGEALDQLEQETVRMGMDLLRRILTWRVEALDAEMAQAREHEGADCKVTFDGKKPLTIATVVGRIQPRRQVCHCQHCGRDFMPLNRLLPAHQHLVITRGLEEWVCWFALAASYEWVHQGLVRMTQDDGVLSPREVQEIILRHGQGIREREKAQAEAILSQDEAPVGEAVLVLNEPPRRGPAWSERIVRAVEEALNTQAWDRPPKGVTEADWERIVTQVRQKEGVKDVRELAHLGPQLRPSDLLVVLDGIVVRGRKKGSRLELRVAHLQTTEGHRYVTGTGETFLDKVFAAIQALGGEKRSLIMLGDGARWIRDFFEIRLAAFPNKELVLDWYHLTKKCKELLSMVTRGRQQRRDLLRQLMPLLWEGKVEQAITILQGLRQTARREDKLDELIAYLQKHRPYIPNYKQRRRRCQFNSSNAAERACNVLVAHRQKHKSMHWILQGADALCALQTLWYNRAWDLYWKGRQLLPLLTSSHPPAFAC